MTKTVTRLSAIILALILATATFSLYTFPAAAQWEGDRDRGGGGDETEIEIENEDTKVSNRVSVTANSGGNSAEGGDSGQGGRGGGIFTLRDGPGGRDSGNAGPGGDGGTVNTGAATAYGTVYNDVNNSRVVVEGCGCDDDGYMSRFSRFFRFGNDGDELEIEIENEDTTVRTILDVDANTGRNSVDGGDSMGSHSWGMWFRQHMNLDERGGGDGGTVRTGEAYADGLVTSIVNRTVVRVENGDDDDEGAQI